MSTTVSRIEILSDETVGQGGFLTIRRVRLRNVHGDGGRSAPYLCDFITRPKGLDAIVVAVWRRDTATGQPQVLLRDGLRIPLHLGRAPGQSAVDDDRRYLFFTEVVAGIIEGTDRGEAGLRGRAVAEIEEEAGYRVAPAAVTLLGAGSFPSPGAMAERFFFAAVEVPAGAEPLPLAGDGSPMEEGATTRWMGLDDAIRACVTGDLADMKTEIALRRLRERIQQP